MVTTPPLRSKLTASGCYRGLLPAASPAFTTTAVRLYQMSSGWWTVTPAAIAPRTVSGSRSAYSEHYASSGSAYERASPDLHHQRARRMVFRQIHRNGRRLDYSR